jgi:predicted nucleic acid-binding protein
VSVPAKAFDLVTADLILKCVSDDVLVEYCSVLCRPKLNLNDGRRRELLGTLAALSLHVAPAEKLAISAHEPDNRFSECAEAADADYLVTGNIRHFPQIHRRTNGSLRVTPAREAAITVHVWSVAELLAA